MPLGLENEEREMIRRAAQGERVYHCETVRERKDGGLVEVSINVSTIRDATGAVVGLWSIAHDIRDRKQSELLQHSLHQKDVLLQEIHHRVKNNLQIISSLLSLQSSDQRMSDPKAALTDAQPRIEALSIIHNQLYASDQSDVTLESVCRSLCTQLSRLYGTERTNIDHEISMPAIRVDMAYAVPLALFVTEAVTNALKHAFPQERGGAIRIVAAEDDEGLVVSVADNGVGLRWTRPAQDMTDSLGFTLMGALATQLGGEFRIEDNGGLRTVLTVPRSYAKENGIFEEDRDNGPI